MSMRCSGGGGGKFRLKSALGDQEHPPEALMMNIYICVRGNEQ